jgi:hypothetical protein
MGGNVTFAKLRCDEKATSFIIPGAWTCSLEKGHAGDHEFHAGHDLDATLVYQWPRSAPFQLTGRPIAAGTMARGPAGWDEYDLIPDATTLELRTLPNAEEMDRRDRERMRPR